MSLSNFGSGGQISVHTGCGAEYGESQPHDMKAISSTQVLGPKYLSYGNFSRSLSSSVKVYSRSLSLRS